MNEPNQNHKYGREIHNYKANVIVINYAIYIA